jgi:flagellar protein FlaG
MIQTKQSPPPIERMMNINPLAVPAADTPRPAHARTVAAAHPAAAVSSVADAQSQPADPQAVKEAAAAAREALKGIRSELDFSVDEDTGKTVVRVVEKQTGTVIRQIPSKEMLEIAKALDRLQGLLVSGSA